MTLSPSQRVNLIKEIATRLGSETYPMIDLTLEQFELPKNDEWNGKSTDYVLAMIAKASDVSLVELAEHLGYTLDNSQASHIEPSFWRKHMFRLFITHLASHKKLAGQLQISLLHYGISGFVAHKDITPTLEWQNQIETALATCDSLVALMHEGFHKSNWTDQEIGFVMGRGVPVFSVRFGESPYGFIGRFQAFNGVDTEPAELAQNLFKAYLKNKATQRKMSIVLMQLFEESDTFAEAKTRIGFLEQLDVWDSTFSSRILSAARSNSQINGSFGVPDRVKNLAKKWSSK